MNDSELTVLRGETARQLLNSPIYQEAYTGTRQAIFEAIAATDPKDTETHLHLLLSIKALERVARYMQAVIESGSVEKFKIESQKKKLTFPFRRSA